MYREIVTTLRPSSKLSTHRSSLIRTRPEKGLQQKSKLAQHVCEEGHRIGWDEARILEIEGAIGIYSIYIRHV
jgi:hypothetical protein